MFENVPSTFAPADQIPVTADYAIGPGDQIMIRAWGQVDIDYSAVVDRGGNIYIPDVGNINVAGVKYGQLHDYLKSAISRVYRNFDLAVTMGQLRSIQVFIVGQASRPGNYTISALSTLVNALFASGGPSSNGSMRRIQVKRGNRLVTDFDLYDLLLKGDKSKDVQLQNGDVIFIPPVGRLVAIAGSVNVPAIYEIKDGSTLDDLLQLAGGLTTTAEAKRVMLDRITDHSIRRVDEFKLDREGLAKPLQDGDVVNVFALLPKFENAVTLRGNVARPGRYPWHEGMRVSDLIPSREALITPDFWEGRNAVAIRPTLPTKDSAVTEGERAEERKLRQLNQQKFRTQIKRDAPDINWDYAVVERTNLEDLTTQLIPFKLGEAISSTESAANLVLRPGDVVTIFSQADFSVPMAKRTTFVRLEGEFARAGVYQVSPGERLLDVIERAGGLTLNAYLFGTQFTRESVRARQQESLNQFVDRLEADIVNATTRGQQLQPESGALLQTRTQNQSRLVQQLRSAQATGRVVFDLKPTIADVASLPNLALEDGDVLTIGARSASVSVVGSVYNTADFVYHPTTTVGEYLREAGGPTREADSGRMYVIRASGAVRSRRSTPDYLAGSFRNLRLMPGDAIVVPQNFDHVPLITTLKDWSAVLGQFGLGIAAIRVIIQGNN
ncbi:MAG: SLBB domain-containing protein [Acidobacteriota bacterium]|nr:SLBB domain-containing protein [Acidobacteriota bacterium]